MTVAELIEQLQAAPQYLPVFVWVDGNRYVATDLDVGFIVEINAEEE